MEVVGQDVPPTRVAASKSGVREREDGREEGEEEGVLVSAQAV